MRIIGLRIIAGSPRGYGHARPAHLWITRCITRLFLWMPLLQRLAAVDGQAVWAAQMATREVDGRNGLWIGHRQRIMETILIGPDGSSVQPYRRLWIVGRVWLLELSRRRARTAGQEETLSWQDVHLPRR